jgi:hypothetical protein
MKSAKIKKPVIYIITAVLIAGIAMTAFIATNDRPRYQEDKSPYDVGFLLENKTLYIGDNSKVGALIDAMPLPDGVHRDKFELHTDMVPYGLTVYYHLEDDSLRISEQQFLRNSVLLFALIDNLDKVEHIGYWNNIALSSTPFRFNYTRADADRIVGGDVRQSAENEEKLAELIEIVQLLKEDK